MVSSCKVDNQGRISIPSTWRRSQGIQPNSELVVTVEEDRLILQTREQRIREAQRMVSQFAAKGVSQVDGLLRERRIAARRERGE